MRPCSGLGPLCPFPAGGCDSPGCPQGAAVSSQGLLSLGSSLPCLLGLPQHHSVLLVTGTWGDTAPSSLPLSHTMLASPFSLAQNPSLPPLLHRVWQLLWGGGRGLCGKEVLVWLWVLNCGCLSSPEK